MKWLENIVLRKAESIISNRHQNQEQEYQAKLSRGLNMVGAQAISKGSAEGEDRITFELTSAVGGRILNVRRYDNRTDRHDSTTYVIPTGEDVGTRVAKIINLELIK